MGCTPVKSTPPKEMPTPINNPPPQKKETPICKPPSEKEPPATIECKASPVVCDNPQTKKESPLEVKEILAPVQEKVFSLKEQNCCKKDCKIDLENLGCTSFQCDHYLCLNHTYEASIGAPYGFIKCPSCNSNKKISNNIV